MAALFEQKKRRNPDGVHMRDISHKRRNVFVGGMAPAEDLEKLEPNINKHLYSPGMVGEIKEKNNWMHQTNKQ